MIKVVTIVGTRPEIIKLCRVIAELDRHTQHVLVHTGQNYDYELNEIFFGELGIRRPDHFLEAVGESTAETIGRIIASADRVLAAEEPDAVLLLGDTNSCLSVIAAKRRKIPIFHMEAGNRCFDQRVPEEINRRIVDHTSDINLTYTEHARRYLLAEGLRPETVIKTGSPMREVLAFYDQQIRSAGVLERLGLAQGQYLVISAHREENVDDEENFTQFLQILNTLCRRFNMPLIVSTHPRTRQQLEAKTVQIDERVRFLKPLGLFDYVHLQKHAFCTVSDSGTITEESSILGFPAVTIRQAHERPEGMDEAVVVMCGLKPARVIEAVELVTAQAGSGEPSLRAVSDYAPDNVSRKVARIILSYVDYVQRTVWFRR